MAALVGLLLAPASASADWWSSVRSLKKGQGMVFAPKAGASVGSMRDGEILRLVDRDAMIGMGDSDALVIPKGQTKEIRVPNVSVLDKESLFFDPSNRWAIFHVIGMCGDFCAAQVWLLGADGTRQRLADDEGPGTHIVFSPDGKRVAMGTRGLIVVDLAKGKTNARADFTSPQWTKDNRLIVRGVETDDAVYELPSSDGPGRRIGGWPGIPPQPEPEADTGPAEPVEIKGKNVKASFWRGEKKTVRTFPLDTPLPKLPASVGKAMGELRGCMLVKEVGGDVVRSFGGEQCKTAWIPCSTFKVPNALIALETGVVDSADTTFKWNGKKQPFKAWEKDTCSIVCC